MKALLTESRIAFHQNLLDTILSVNERGIPTNADKDSNASTKIALTILDQMGTSRRTERLPGQTSGNHFEQIVALFLQHTFLNFRSLRPGSWGVEHITGARMMLSRFEQYSHLIALEKAARENPELATALGSDYFIKPDIVVFRNPEKDSAINIDQNLVDFHAGLLAPIREENGLQPILHASVSCKWTLRSDRAQNARSEGLNLVKNRKGALPHIAVVTGEPLPARIASLALGTGEIDSVYHFALPELIIACQQFPDAEELVRILVEGKRLKDIADLPLDLAT